MNLMKPLVRALMVSVALPAAVAATARAQETATPPGDGATVLAEVNGEPITLADLRRLIGELGAEDEADVDPRPEPTPSELLERLINLRLVFQEARNIGFDELPEFATAVNAFRTDALRGMLLNRVLVDAPPPTDAEIAARYRDLAAEFQVSTALFARREDAEAFRAAIDDPAGFDDAAARAGEAGTTERIQVGAWIPRRELAPAIDAVVEALADGAVSDPFEFGTGFAVVRRIGMRVPDDAALRERAEREAAAAARSKALDTFLGRLRSERMKIDTELLDGLDFDAKVDDFDAFLADDRAVATVDDAEPIRVADLARTLKKRMFHGVEQAAEKGRLNRSKANVMEELTTEAALQAEARRRGLDRLPEFEEDFADYEDRILFGMFVRRVVDRDVKVAWEEVEAYYREHVDEFTDPGMVRLDSLVFAAGDDARRTLDRLNAGADLAWTRDNASGQVPAADLDEGSDFAGRLLLLDVLPAGLRDAIAGAAAGEYRLYVDPAGNHHVVAIVERIEPRPRPIEQVQNEIAARIQADERRAVLDGWFAKLREVSEIDVQVEGQTLDDLVARGAAPGR